jgi:hypothetical protein
MARRLSIPMIEALSHVARYGQLPADVVAPNTVAAIQRHAYTCTALGITAIYGATRLTDAGWSALPVDVRDALRTELHETALAIVETEAELILATPVSVGSGEWEALPSATEPTWFSLVDPAGVIVRTCTPDTALTLARQRNAEARAAAKRQSSQAARVDAAYAAMMDANAATPYVSAEYERCDRVLRAELILFTNGDQPWADTLRAALTDSGEEIMYYIDNSEWPRESLMYRFGYGDLPTDDTDEDALMAHAADLYPALCDVCGLPGTAERPLASLPPCDARSPYPTVERHADHPMPADARTWYGARDSVGFNRGSSEYDRAMAHKSFGPWVGFHAARLGILDAIEAERASWRASKYDEDMSSQLRCAALAAAFAADPNATQATVDGLRFSIWTNDPAPTDARTCADPGDQEHDHASCEDAVIDAADVRRSAQALAARGTAHIHARVRNESPRSDSSPDVSDALYVDESARVTGWMDELRAVGSSVNTDSARD